MERDPRLHRMSHEHHQALVLARTARRAAGKVDPSAIWSEVTRRFRDELEPHFRIEEEILLPALRAAGRGDLVDRTLADHAALRAIVVSEDALDERLRRFGELLHDHVRFEERELFETAQTVLDGAVLDRIAALS